MDRLALAVDDVALVQHFGGDDVLSRQHVHLVGRCKETYNRYDRPMRFYQLIDSIEAKRPTQRRGDAEKVRIEKR